MVVPVGSAVVVAWDGGVGGIEYTTNTEVGVVHAHTEDNHHLISFDNPTLRRYAQYRWPLRDGERGRTWDHLIVIDDEEKEEDGSREDQEWNSTGVSPPTPSQRMAFVLERPSSRETAVRAMYAIYGT